MSIFSLIEVSGVYFVAKFLVQPIFACFGVFLDSLKSYYITCALDSDVHAAKKAEQGYPTCLKMISYLSLGGGGGGDCIDNAKRPASIHEASWNLRLLSGFPSYRNSTRR
ncbi:hypothetical protein NC653_020574 [Populus alba x Populus x berolinensis]|uniref:Uncharacterized protein n=1 Tax=Populus alba x Populus x berolinensis TaxID=444605 RepID=A0AAD6ML37_9ROSI|nr:hypothetical protein NC653_020574 [Populus alba x Populus x berolinensis]